MADQTNREDLILLWQALSAQRLHYDNLAWQAPALSMTAQAFLMTLALGSGTADAGRVVAATLGVGLALVSIQLQAKHRRFELLDSFTLEELERRIGFHIGAESDTYRMHAQGSVLPASANAEVDRRLAKVRRGPSRFWTASSFTLWVGVQCGFAVVSMGIVLGVGLANLFP